MSLPKLATVLLLATSLAACASQTPGAGSSSKKIDFARLNSPNLDCSSIKPHEWGWVTPRSGCVEYERRP
jgi:hypothetical protein